MNSLTIHEQRLPDVATSDAAHIRTTLDWVGMSEIALPFRLLDADRGEIACQGRAQAYVNICRPDVKGIHMSRLYLLLEAFAEQQLLTPRSLSDFLADKLATHREISDSACLALRFDLYLRRPALKSDHQGWKAYPVELLARLQQGRTQLELKLSIPYSSTCPCSASLSRQLLDQAMQREFGDGDSIDKAQLSRWLLSEQGSFATPHSQRSYAHLRIRLAPQQAFPLQALIERVEACLQTPVQTAVKREDEQEFARLNGHNLMFCEDAARRIKRTLDSMVPVEDFWLKVEHQESLHAHNAVAIATKGVAAGFKVELGG
ncbi:GTP cyclohydrolase FolE2 [Marinobacterium arenosum]|uniref:GTP cyclohydrolase FolE2 n=1 Tax=Marinobacterium arenosum TaxID=2862496 RepID=UPI001C977213|nr:GTP cyclohydrolase FolE2 [Marinobacterium arenosum]MBY4677335.1 GTP cyclohydrolase FolE2 [Marinobacterium arenosum]